VRASSARASAAAARWPAYAVAGRIRPISAARAAGLM